MLAMIYWYYMRGWKVRWILYEDMSSSKGQENFPDPSSHRWTVKCFLRWPFFYFFIREDPEKHVSGQTRRDHVRWPERERGFVCKYLMPFGWEMTTELCMSARWEKIRKNKCRDERQIVKKWRTIDQRLDEKEVVWSSGWKALEARYKFSEWILIRGKSEWLGRLKLAAWDAVYFELAIN